MAKPGLVGGKSGDGGDKSKKTARFALQQKIKFLNRGGVHSHYTVYPKLY